MANNRGVLSNAGGNLGGGLPLQYKPIAESGMFSQGWLQALGVVGDILRGVWGLFTIKSGSVLSQNATKTPYSLITILDLPAGAAQVIDLGQPYSGIAIISNGTILPFDNGIINVGVLSVGCRLIAVGLPSQNVLG